MKNTINVQFVRDGRELQVRASYSETLDDWQIKTRSSAADDWTFREDTRNVWASLASISEEL